MTILIRCGIIGLLLILILTSNAFAVNKYRTRQNPFTSKLDYVIDTTSLEVGDITATGTITGVTVDTQYIENSSNGPVSFRDDIALINPSPPTSPTSSGIKGEISWDGSYFYVCTATNTWERVAIATWTIATENVIFAAENVVFAAEQVVYP